jgi:hypothetical protein
LLCAGHKNPLTLLFVEFSDFHSGSVDGYHITVSLCANQGAPFFHHHHNEPLPLSFHLKKIQDLQSGEFLDYFVLGNNILYSGRRLQLSVSWCSRA